jgi:hypothetical protein
MASAYCLTKQRSRVVVHIRNSLTLKPRVQSPVTCEIHSVQNSTPEGS